MLFPTHFVVRRGRRQAGTWKALVRASARAFLQLQLQTTDIDVTVADVLDFEHQILRCRSAFQRTGQTVYRVGVKRDRHRRYVALWNDQLEMIIDLRRRFPNG